MSAELDRVKALAAKTGMRWIVPGDNAWPERLADLDHVEPVAGATGAPLGLWVRGEGNLDALVKHSVSVVGARDCTGYGAEQAAELAADVASAGFTVVSGAAFGIDACGHRGALALARPTIAVLACDAATSYPRAHAALLERIVDVGLVVSEQPPGSVPTKARFLSRNRLIAALTRATVVVEARRRSGALNTLGWADALGRTTMAVPGPVTSPLSVGTHQAIRDGKAILVTNGTDVLTELSDFDGPPPSSGTAYDRLAEREARVLDALDWSRAHDTAAIARLAKVSPDATGEALRSLTAAGWATAVPDGWVLSRRADLASADSDRTVEG